MSHSSQYPTDSRLPEITDQPAAFSRTAQYPENNRFLEIVLQPPSVSHMIQYPANNRPAEKMYQPASYSRTVLDKVTQTADETPKPKTAENRRSFQKTRSLLKFPTDPNL